MPFAYDADGNRVKAVYGTTTVYTPFPDYELTVSGGTETIRTTYRLAGRIVAVKSRTTGNGALYDAYTDHLGSIVALGQLNTFQANSLARFDPFGNFRTTPASSVNPDMTDHGFTGHRHNNTGTNNLGLIYMNARYYLPEVGRFISPDSLVPDPGNPQSYNRCAYAYNNPVNLSDPTGHCPFCVGAAIGAIGGFGISYGAQVIANIGQNGLTVDALTNVNWAAVGGATVAGAVGGATFGIGTAFLGGGFAGTVISGAVSGGLAGQAGQATENVLSGQTMTAGLGEIGDIATDAIIGGASAGLGHRLLTRGLQSITDDVSSQLATDPLMAESVLMPKEYAAGRASTSIARMQYGNAVERMAASELRGSTLLKPLIKHVGGPNNPDFVGRGALGNIKFDITTATPRSVQAHLSRPYGRGLNLITYERPSSFGVFP